MFNKSKRATVLLLTLILLAGFPVNYYMAKSHEITAGVFSMPDFYLFSTFVNKPWNKLSVYSLGMLSAIFFIEIKKYKKCLIARENLS